MDRKKLAQLKKDFRDWSGGFAPESTHQITVYVDYALRDIGATPDEVRRALSDWFEADDPDDDIYKPGDVRHTQAEFYSFEAMRKWREAKRLK